MLTYFSYAVACQWQQQSYGLFFKLYYVDQMVEGAQGREGRRGQRRGGEHELGVDMHDRRKLIKIHCEQMQLMHVHA